jgi:hypothetical protein
MSIQLDWQKSSFSEGDGPQCIELAHHGDGVALRESDMPEAILTADHASLRALILRIKSDGFAHLT